MWLKHLSKFFIPLPTPSLCPILSQTPCAFLLPLYPLPSLFPAFIFAVQVLAGSAEDLMVIGIRHRDPYDPHRIGVLKGYTDGCTHARSHFIAAPRTCFYYFYMHYTHKSVQPQLLTTARDAMCCGSEPFSPFDYPGEGIPKRAAPSSAHDSTLPTSGFRR